MSKVGCEAAGFAAQVARKDELAIELLYSSVQHMVGTKESLWYLSCAYS